MGRPPRLHAYLAADEGALVGDENEDEDDLRRRVGGGRSSGGDTLPSDLGGRVSARHRAGATKKEAARGQIIASTAYQTAFTYGVCLDPGLQHISCTIFKKAILRDECCVIRHVYNMVDSRTLELTTLSSQEGHVPYRKGS